MAARIDPDVRAALTELVFEFARRVDIEQGRGTELLFLPDGYYQYDGRAEHGRDDIRAAYDRRRARGERTARHVFTNLTFARGSDGHLNGRSLMILFAADGPAPIDSAAPIVVGDVVDVYAEHEGGFLLAHRVITPVFVDHSRPAVLPLGTQ
ncbi:nuclear transport factor 2 family protein [Amycolatopsis pithecellobii]|uniref:SnoaL-like domain-containing protein n=1 Tax=Amycolatopsis pithecellobii TaxID=664692 RepID=A0A6N7ZBC4_9PSEU|nr:nuclear transport factor 2 family protein [Amycolatopsis pithecellobii]MTD59030.1 hypothetical protein [Amycolatopsis pithecellobii]